MKRIEVKRLEVDLKVSELAAGGDGVAIHEVDGERRAVFLSGVAEGELIRARVDFSTRPARGRVVSILGPSVDRVEPACPHVETCGACDWMHLSPDAQADAHAKIVSRILPPAFRHLRVGTHRAGRGDEYRIRTRLHVEANRNGDIAVGMHARGSRKPITVDRCMILHPAVEHVRRALPGWLRGARGRGEAQIALSAPVPNEERKATLELRWSGDLPATVFAAIERATQDRSSALAQARIFSGEVRKPAVVGAGRTAIVAADGALLQVGDGGFSQANEASNALLAKHVVAAAEKLAAASAGEARELLELYAGAGNLTVLLARSFDVTAIESDPEACAAAKANLAGRKLSARIVEADAATFAIPKKTKLIVLDPPRTGARAVAEALARKPSAAVVYVSCDPPTLGRDLATLTAAGYTIDAVDTFEMFPQTSHVETVVVLVPPSRS